MFNIGNDNDNGRCNDRDDDNIIMMMQTIITRDSDTGIKVT